MTDERTTRLEAETLQVAAELRVALGGLTRRLREQTTGTDFTPSQTAVLSRLDREGPATMSMLAKAAGVRPQSMGATVATLEEAGMISGSPDPRDGRKTVLALTDSARDLFATGRLAKEDWLFRAIRTELTADEHEKLVGAIEVLRRLAEAP